MGDQQITYRDWKTGEECTYNLSFSHPTEHKTNLICPLDNTPIIYAYDHLGKTHFCPNCGTNYYHEINTQDSVNVFFKNHLEQLKKELVNLDKKRIDLLFFLEKAEESLQSNKANLSAKECKTVQFKSKEQKAAEERFSHLADHLFPSKIKDQPENSA